MTIRRLLDPDEALRRLETRLGPLHARLRLGMEREYEAKAFGHGLNFLHIENMPMMQVLIELVLRMTGTYRWGRTNAGKVQVSRNIVHLPTLPQVFDGFTILHLSDLHADMSAPAMQRAAELALGLEYDLCVLTGDYRGRTYGDCKPCLEGVSSLREALRGDIYAVLGNHDSIIMVPDLEALGIRVLLNESVAIDRDNSSIYGGGGRRPFLPRRQHRKGGGGRSARLCFGPAISHSRDLPTGRARGVRSDAERTHAWRADLPTRRHSHLARSRSAARVRRWRLAPCGHGGLYLGWDGVVGRSCAIQQSARNHAAPT